MVSLLLEVDELSLYNPKLYHQGIISYRLEKFSLSRLFSSMIFFRLVPPKLLVSMRGKQFSCGDSTSPNDSYNGSVSGITKGNISGGT